MCVCMYVCMYVRLRQYNAPQRESIQALRDTYECVCVYVCMYVWLWRYNAPQRGSIQALRDTYECVCVYVCMYGYGDIMPLKEGPFRHCEIHMNVCVYVCMYVWLWRYNAPQRVFIQALRYR
jgi:hypothetical protein